MSARTSAPGTGTKTRWRVAYALNRLPWTGSWADLAARIRYAATTDQPQSARTVARARWIGRFCSVVLLALGAWSAATGTLPSTLVALFTIPAGIWCWRYQRRMRGAR